MSGIFVNVSVLILCICLIRRLFAGTMSMRHRYGLWLLAALLLLLLPVSHYLPRSALSIQNVSESVQSQLLEEYPQAAMLVNNLETGQVYVDPESEVLLIRAACVDWQLIFLGIWALGALGMLVWTLWVNRRFSRFLLQYREAFSKKSSRTVSEDWLTLPVYLVKDLYSPCLLCLKGQAAVYLPDRLLEDPSGMRHALAHEMSHYRQGDLFWNWLRSALLILYWFHPLVWLAAWLSRQDCELACDESAICLLGEEERFAYGRTLLSLVKRKFGAGSLVCGGTRMTAGTRSLKSRIEKIAHRPRISFWSMMGFYLLLSLTVLLTFSRAANTDRLRSAGEMMEELIREKEAADAPTLEHAQKLAEYLTEHHLAYVGDHVSSSQIVGTCIRAAGIQPNASTELQTSQEPYAYRMVFRTEDQRQLDLERIRSVSILTFASIDNLGLLEVYVGADGIHKEELLLQVSREEAMEFYGISELAEYGESKEQMLKLVRRVAEKF